MNEKVRESDGDCVVLNVIVQAGEKQSMVWPHLTSGVPGQEVGDMLG